MAPPIKALRYFDPPPGEPPSVVGRRLVARPRHPLYPKKQIHLVAPTREKLAARVAYVEQLKSDLKLGIKSAAEVERVLVRLVHGVITVARIYARWQETLTNPNTRLRAEQARKQELDRLMVKDPLELSAERMARWRAECLRDGRAETSIAVAFGYLRAALQFAVQARALDALPWGSWKPRARSKRTREAARTLEELSAILAAAWALDVAARARGEYSDLCARVATLAMLGLRNREGAALGWSDFETPAEPDPWIVRPRFQNFPRWRELHPEWTRPELPIKRASGDPTPIVVHPDLRTILEAHREYLRSWGYFREDGPVFPGHRSGVRSGPQWRDGALVVAELVKRLALTAKVSDPRAWVAHSLRDTFVTLEAAGHRELRAVQSRSRSKSLTTLFRYLRARDRSLMPDVGMGRVALPPLAEQATKHDDPGGAEVVTS